ncbi:MAG: hypothetical protein NWE83_09135 [Candidatus Bathyarchaeota archaeon]|nr:hypothetical protein [Candidatus Bathyarchaeota archaeon]
MQAPLKSARERIGVAQFMLFLAQQLSTAEYQKLVQLEYQYINLALKKYSKK